MKPRVMAKRLQRAPVLESAWTRERLATELRTMTYGSKAGTVAFGFAWETLASGDPLSPSDRRTLRALDALCALGNVGADPCMIVARLDLWRLHYEMTERIRAVMRRPTWEPAREATTLDNAAAILEENSLWSSLALRGAVPGVSENFSTTADRALVGARMSVGTFLLGFLGLRRGPETLTRDDVEAAHKIAPEAARRTTILELRAQAAARRALPSGPVKLRGRSASGKPIARDLFEEGKRPHYFVEAQAAHDVLAYLDGAMRAHATRRQRNEVRRHVAVLVLTCFPELETRNDLWRSRPPQALSELLDKYPGPDAGPDDAAQEAMPSSPELQATMTGLRNEYLDQYLRPFAEGSVLAWMNPLRWLQRPSASAASMTVDEGVIPSSPHDADHTATVSPSTPRTAPVPAGIARGRNQPIAEATPCRRAGARRAPTRPRGSTRPRP